MMNSRPERGDDQGQESDRGELHVQLAEIGRALAEADSERRASQEREALLRNELQHRVRNMLAIIRSIFSRTVAAGGALDDVADHFRGRLDAVARYQNFQSFDPGGTIDFEQIVRDELHSFQFGDDPRIRKSGTEVRLPLDIAQVLGLAIHELVTNSIKFGVLAMIEERGQLEIFWSISDARLRFTWRETGISVLSPAPLRCGFGREFIEQALPYQIGAETRFELRPGGIFCEVVTPLGTLAPPTDAGA